MNRDEPNFIWKGLNAVRDMGCIIENELPDILPNKRYDTYSI
ncbi:phage tail protein, partial [Listeria monocytogenes]|nr:phage tail protein [Listeria monocytogenes]